VCCLCHTCSAAHGASTKQPKECTLQLNPYLNFNGNCEAAFKFYERCLGGKIVMMLTHKRKLVAPVQYDGGEADGDTLAHRHEHAIIHTLPDHADLTETGIA
jgi:hypothetical protein